MAIRDLRSIHYYISNSLMEENIANNYIKKILASISTLSIMPKSHNIMEMFYKQKYRRLVVGSYIVIYNVDDEEEIVYIVRIIYGGRNYLNNLLK